ncbi:MAG: discoidin domain-containing protein [Candidatus Kariarchaeaceae archaeon]|jgi:hypothetical protein
MIKYLLYLIVLLLVFYGSSFAIDYYVDDTGSDSNGCTNATTDACLTIEFGYGKLGDGDTLHVRDGTYQEQVDITAGGSVSGYRTIQNYSGESPILDGNSKAIDYGFVWGGNGNYIKIIGFEIRNFNRNGIRSVSSYSADYLEIRNCTIHDNGSDNQYDGGIYVYGQTTAGDDYLTIDNNEIYRNDSDPMCIYRYDYVTVSNNLMYLHPDSPSTQSDVHTFIAGIAADVTENISVHDNYFYMTQKAPRITDDVCMSGLGTCEVYNNVFAYSGFCGLDIHNPTIQNITLKNNIFAYNAVNGTNPKGTGTDNNDYFNNVFYGNGHIDIMNNETATNTGFENNIFQGPHHWHTYRTSGSPTWSTHDYNNYYGTSDYLSGGLDTEYTYAQVTTWETNSLNVNPSFNNPALLDFASNNASLDDSGNNPSGDCDEIGLCTTFVDPAKVIPFRTLTVDSSSGGGTPSKSVDLIAFLDADGWQSDSTTPWIIYDLGNSRSIRYIGINGASSIDNWPNEFKIEVSSDKVEWTIIIDDACVTPGSAPWYNMTQWFDAGQSYNGRYIRLDVDSTKSGNVYIREFYALGPLGTIAKAYFIKK